jgi:hypothetical protein
VVWGVAVVAGVNLAISLGMGASLVVSSCMAVGGVVPGGGGGGGAWVGCGEGSVRPGPVDEASTAAATTLPPPPLPVGVEGSAEAGTVTRGFVLMAMEAISCVESEPNLATLTRFGLSLSYMLRTSKVDTYGLPQALPATANLSRSDETGLRTGPHGSVPIVQPGQPHFPLH